MKQNYLYRIIKSQDTSYILTPDRMWNWRNQSNGHLDYQTFYPGGNSLSKAVVKKILRTPMEQAGRTRYWRFINSLSDDGRHILSIGCQKFGADAVVALKRWCGLPAQ